MMYVGKADSLQIRIWKNHFARSAVMTRSAMRRNVAHHLGIAIAADIKARRYQPTADEVAVIREWLYGCHIAWVGCENKAAAEKLESAFKAEHLPRC